MLAEVGSRESRAESSGAGRAEQGRGSMEDGPAAAHGFAKQMTVRRGVNEADPVAVDGAEQHDEAGELEQAFTF